LVGAAIVSLLGACQPGAAPSESRASPAAAAGATPASGVDATARQWLAAFQAKDLDAMLALWAPDGVWEGGATGETFSGGPRAERSGWAEALAMMIAAKDADVVALGDGVAVVTYTFHGPTPAHSSPIDVQFLAVLHVRDATGRGWRTARSRPGRRWTPPVPR
jgi:ketosteroid isomerase-like protein